MEYLTNLSNWIQTHFTGLITFFLVLGLFYAFRRIGIIRLQKLTEKTTNDYDDVFVEILKSFGFTFGATLSLSIAFAVAGADLFQMKALAVLILIIATYQVAKIVSVLFTFTVQKTTQSASSPASLQGLKTILMLIIWLIGGLMIVSVLGYNISSLVAGLGIGGIAVALALQNILGDIFSSFSIYFDQPFTAGDYIIVGTNEGIVEKIGLKSTRIRSLRGEEIVISNRELTETVIQNFGRLQRRRVLQVLGLAYETPSKKIEKLYPAVKKLIDDAEKTEFERLYFKDFGDSALLFELSYYVNSSNFEDFAQIKSAINLQLKNLLEDHAITIAYPTQTVYLSNSTDV